MRLCQSWTSLVHPSEEDREGIAALMGSVSVSLEAEPARMDGGPCSMVPWALMLLPAAVTMLCVASLVGPENCKVPSTQRPGSELGLCLSSPLTGALGSYCFRSSFPIIHPIWFPWRKLARAERELSPVLVPALPSHLFILVLGAGVLQCAQPH